MRFFALLLLVGTVHADGVIINDSQNLPLRAIFESEVRVFDDRGEHVGICAVNMYRGEPYPGGSSLDNFSFDPSITLDCEAGGYELHFSHDGTYAATNRIGQFWGRGGPQQFNWWKTFGYDFVEMSPTEVSRWVDMTVDNGQSLSLNPNSSTYAGDGATFVNATFSTTARFVQPEPALSWWEQSGTAASVNFEFTGMGDGPITRVVGAGGVSQSLTAVPEPSGFLMLGLVAVGYAGWRRGRTRFYT